MAVLSIDKNIKNGGFTAKTHGANIQLVEVPVKILFQGGQLIVVIPFANSSEKLFF